MKKNFYLLSLFVLFLCFSGVQARVEFATRNSHVVVKNSRSGFTLSQPKKVFGWSKDSIVTDIDQRSAEQWEEHYQEGATVGDQGTRTVRDLNALQKGWYYEDPLGSIIFQEPYPTLDDSYLSLHRAPTGTPDLVFWNSNAIVFLSDMLAQKCLEIAANSNAIIDLDNNVGPAGSLRQLVIQNSNVAVHFANAAVSGSVFSQTILSPNIVKTTSLAIANSNAIVSLNFALPIQNSNAIVSLNFALPIQNSNAIIKNTRDINNNSNAILVIDALNKANSNAIVSIDTLNAANSNTLLYLTKNNSNALLFGITNNSNALLFGITNNSNTLSFLARNNSNAITITREELGLIGFGKLEPTITVNTNQYSLFWPLLLGEDARLIVPMNATVDGRGLFIDVPQDIPGVIDIAAGDTLQFNNIELRNFNDAAFLFGDTASNVVFGDRTTIYLGGCQLMSFDWSFTGETVLDGQGSTLDLNSHTISIASPGTLTIKDVNLKGVKNNNIRVIGENSTVEFKSAGLYLESDFTLTAGSMRFTRDVTIVGTSSFVYATGRPSTISTRSTLFIGNGITFNYSPSVAHRDLIVMEDETAALYLNGCTLSSTTTGLRLTTGTLLAEHKNVLLNAGAVSLSQAIEFGNGTAANDLNIEILPGASFDVQSGILNYNNTF